MTTPTQAPFSGSTLFVGDSMMVGTTSLVPVDGERREVAKVGAPSTWALANVTPESLRGIRNMVVLTGVNDIGGRGAEAIADTVVAIWKKGLAVGARVYGATLPPFKGWSAFQPIASFEAKRRSLNESLRRKAAELGVIILPLDQLLADSSDPERLSLEADSGDHLHPKKGVLAKALASSTGTSPGPGSGVVPVQPPETQSPSLRPALLFLAAAGYLVWRMR
jgi:hypothetical protein